MLKKIIKKFVCFFSLIMETAFFSAWRQPIPFSLGHVIVTLFLCVHSQSINLDFIKTVPTNRHYFITR